MDYTWIRNGIHKSGMFYPGSQDHKGHTWDPEWNGISWIGIGIYRDQEWYIQGSGMVYTGIRNSIYRDQKCYIQGSGMAYTGITNGIHQEKKSKPLCQKPDLLTVNCSALCLCTGVLYLSVCVTPARPWE